MTVSTFAELDAAVRRDEPFIRLEGEAKNFYEQRSQNLLGGGVVGAVPGLLIAGPIGAAIGAAVGAAVSSSASSYSGLAQRELYRYLFMYYRRTSTGVTYIELTHR